MNYTETHYVTPREGMYGSEKGEIGEKEIKWEREREREINYMERDRERERKKLSKHTEHIKRMTMHG